MIASPLTDENGVKDSTSISCSGYLERNSQNSSNSGIYFSCSLKVSIIVYVINSLKNF